MQEQKLMWRQQAACRDSDTDVFFPESDADGGSRARDLRDLPGA